MIWGPADECKVHLPESGLGDGAVEIVEDGDWTVVAERDIVYATIKDAD